MKFKINLVIAFLICLSTFFIGCGNSPTEETIKSNLIGNKVNQENVDSISSFKIISTNKNSNSLEYVANVEWIDDKEKALINGDLNITYKKDNGEWKLVSVDSKNDKLNKKPNFEISDEELKDKLKGMFIYSTGPHLELIEGKVEQEKVVNSKFLDSQIKSIEISNKNFDENSGCMLFDMVVTAQIKNVEFNVIYDGKIKFSYPNWQPFIELKEQNLKYNYPDKILFYFSDNGYNKVSGICNLEPQLNSTDGIINLNIKSSSDKFQGSYKVKINKIEGTNQLNLVPTEWINKSNEQFKMYSIKLFADYKCEFGGILYDSNNKEVGSLTYNKQ